MKATYKIFLRSDNKNIDGTNTICLLFTSKRKLKKISLGVKVHQKDWNPKTNPPEVKKSDSEHLRKNKYIRKYNQKALDIIDKYFLEDRFLSCDEFERNFKNKLFGSKSFYEFVENEKQVLTFSEATFADYDKQIRKLKDFRPEIAFSDIDLKFLQDYDYYMKYTRVPNNSKNTRLNSLKFLKQMLNKAIKKDIIKDSPFKYYPLERIEGNKEHLTKFELDKLVKLLNSDKLTKNQHTVLEYFLFACYTGVRYQDVLDLKHKYFETDIIEGKEYKVLVFDMHKTGKPVVVPVVPFLYKYINEGLPNQKVFQVFTNQSTNRHLKKIAEAAGINKKITFHTARHTLGSTGSDMGMDIQTISAILGHTDIRTTQTYTKVSRKKKLDGLMLMKGKS